MDEFNRIKDFIKRFPTISDIVTNVWLGIRNIPENLQITKEESPSCVNTCTHTEMNPNTIDLDEKDKQLIEKLAQNGRMPFAKLAEELDLGTNTVIKKFNRIRECGIVKVSIQINPNMLGYIAAARFNLAFDGESALSPIVDKLSKIPDVKLLIKTSGQYELAVHSLVRDLDQLITQQEEITNIAAIAKMEFSLKRPQLILPGKKEYISTF